jgi:hypothetical protein
MNILKMTVGNSINTQAKKKKEQDADVCKKLKNEMEDKIASRLTKITHSINDYQDDFKQLMAEVGVRVMPMTFGSTIDIEAPEAGADSKPNTGGL